MSASEQQLEFVDRIRAQKHTLHQLRMKLQSLPKLERFGALMLAFTDTESSTTVFADQETAGRLLVEALPKCPDKLESTLLAIAPTWNVSVEQLPFYLADVFGVQNVIDTANLLADNFPEDSREANALSTVTWWLRGRTNDG